MFEAEAEAAQMWVDHESHAELLTLMKAFKNIKRSTKIFYHAILFPWTVGPQRTRYRTRR